MTAVIGGDVFWRKNRAGLCSVAVALSLIAGEAAGFASSVLCDLWPWTAYIAAFILLVSIGWEIKGMRHLFIGMVGLSLAWHAEAFRHTIEEKALQISKHGAPPDFTLKVESDPKITRRKSGNRITFNSRIGAIPTKVVSRQNGSTAIPKRGELWRCGGWLTLKKGSPHRYSRRTLWVTNGGIMERLKEENAFDEWYPKLASSLAERAETGLEWCPQTAALNKAMLLGMSTEMPWEKRQTFSNAGTVHVFAISGLHVMTVAALINSLLSRLGAGAAARCAAAIPTLIAYVAISGGRPSAVRAAVMAAAWLISAMFSRKPDSLTAWSTAAILTYSFCPTSIFDPGCTLSFVVMLGLLLWIRWSSQFAPIALPWLDAATFEHVIGNIGEASKIKRKYDIANWLSGALGISLATWIAGTPVVATLFGKISLSGIFANVIVVPLAGVSVILGTAGIGASFFSAHLSALFNNLAAFCTMGMELISRAAASIPCGYFNTLPWKWSDCAIWYGAWIILFAVFSKHLKKREAIAFHDWQQE